MLKDIAPKGNPAATKAARRLRRQMTLPEVILWQILRKRPSGFKFRRQHPTGPFVLDFFCSDARLAIEVDGEVHSRGRQPERDVRRDEWMKEAGIDTLRIPALELLGDADAVMRWILSETAARLPLHHPAMPAGPPPRAKLGED